MTDTRPADKEMSAGNVDDMVAAVDTGARNPEGALRNLIPTIAFIWACFQLYIASNLPFWLTEVTGLRLIVTNSDARLIHLAFALCLAALAFPLLRSSPRRSIPWYDWLLAGLGIVVCLYTVVLRDEIAIRAGLPTTNDLIISTVGMIVLAIAVFRALGLPLLIVASVFMLYVFGGDAQWLPDAIQWKGASYGKAMWHFWMQNEGVFGVALGVSASLIFLFVLFGSILEKAGAGNYFIKIAFALLGHLRGGPAKASVVASAMSGLYSGSSIANTVTTGTFTIPLMKRTGFSAEKAGAVEVASSTNGQLTPPVMGAAAFLIAEFTGVSYTDILKHALVPALVSYIALVYIVHLEALKLGLQGLPKRTTARTLLQKLTGFLIGFGGLALLSALIYFGFGWIKTALPGFGFTAAVLVMAAGYLLLLWYAAGIPDLEVDDPDAPITELPPVSETARAGYYYILPIVLLIWCIIIERLSPALSAFWATIAMIIVALTQHPLKAMMRGQTDFAGAFKRGVGEWIDGMIAGARNMIGIAVATGAAGIIIGTISLTGAHQVIGEFVEWLSGGSLMAMLILVAVMSLILGMGLPTTANYIVVSSLMAPVIVSLGAANGLVVPLIAVHLFVFYFGILADDTPPVGLAAFAAAAISRGDPIKTGIQGFTYDIRTALLPFMFIFNTELLLIDVTFVEAIIVFLVAVVAMLVFAAATQGYFFTRSRFYETIMLLIVAFTLFRPGFWLDQISPPFIERAGTEVEEILGSAADGSLLRVQVSGPDFNDPDSTRETMIELPADGAGDGAALLSSQGLSVLVEDGVAKLDEPLFGTPFERLGREFDFYGDAPVQISAVSVPNERAPKEVFYIPAFLLLGLVILLQRRRQTVPAF
ncbi:MAG: TRAP transporter permease [Pseudomonadota bacterium]